MFRSLLLLMLTLAMVIGAPSAVNPTRVIGPPTLDPTVSSGS